MIGQPKGEIGPHYHQRQHDEHRQMERNGAEDHFAQFAVPDALYDEQIDSDRRRDLPKLNEEDENDAEQQRVDAVTRQHRKDQRHRNHNHAQAFDEAAEHGVEYEQRQEKSQPREMQANDECRHLLADACEADDIGENISREDDEQDISGKSDRAVRRLDQSARREMAEHGAEKDRQAAADRRALGRGDEAGIDAAERAADQNGEWQDID